MCHDTLLENPTFYSSAIQKRQKQIKLYDPLMIKRSLIKV